ncbi:MAG: hypothetical protein ACT4OY_02110 [Alphaproteobacteria bacterium]
MRVELKKLLEQLGVGHVLSPYETHPWLHYDEAQGMTCSAEVRMGPGGDDIEAEIQMLKDSGDEGEGAASGGGGGRQQIMLMRACPALSKEWSPVDLKIKGENFVNKMHDWEGKGCNFFRACIQAIQMGQMPNIDELIEKELDDDGGMGGGRRGKIGRKSPKIKPAQLLGLKKM